MNKKGFTLVELLAIIVVLGIVSTLISVGVVNTYKKAKNKSYTILVNNIKIAAQNYYQECEYGDLSSSSYGALACSITTSGGKTYTIVTLEKLVKLGILKSNNKDDSENKVVVNPKTNESINNCELKIEKKVTGANLKVEYVISLNSNNGNSDCPTTGELQGE